MPLDPAGHLQKYGWQQGQGLRKGSRAKPITISQKRTLSGVGKDTYNSFEFWDALFDGVAAKIANGGPREAPQLTSTGIYSPHAPCPGTPVGEDENALSKHADVVAQIEASAAKATLYRSFRRGRTIEGVQEEVVQVQLQVEEVSTVAERKKKRRRLVEREDGNTTEETKEERKARRARKKAKRLEAT